MAQTQSRSWWLKLSNEWWDEKKGRLVGPPGGMLAAVETALSIMQALNTDDIMRIPTAEIKGYVPTRHELIQIVNFWCEAILDIKGKQKDIGGSQGWEDRVVAFGKERIKHVEAGCSDESPQRPQGLRSGGRRVLEL
jgi:hypothetical protein